jgi:hypothetical protein
MKRCLLALLFLLNTSLCAEKAFEFALNPIPLINGKLPLTLRVALSQKMALGLHFQGRFFSYGVSPVHGLGGGISFKFFLNNRAIDDSWYLEPTLSADFNKPGNVGGFWGITPTLMAGHTWVWTSGFVINLGVGVSYSHNFISSKFWTSNESYGIQGLMPTGELSIGYAW